MEQLFHSKHLDEFLQIRMPVKIDAKELGLQSSERRIRKSRRKCRHLRIYNSLYKNLRQNFRGGH
jgi:hypothetical protein